MQRTDITSKEIYKLEAQETILRQRSRTASQLNEWINWFEELSAAKKKDERRMWPRNRCPSPQTRIRAWTCNFEAGLAS